jgi:hypothetical protein
LVDPAFALAELLEPRQPAGGKMAGAHASLANFTSVGSVATLVWMASAAMTASDADLKISISNGDR